MSKVVIDTNVIISAGISVDGNPAKIFEMLLSGKLENYTTDDIIDEVKNVINRDKIKKILDFQDREFIINNFERNSEKIVSSYMFFEVKEDPKDNKFLDCAVSANVDYIISGDEHLLKMKEFKGITIISPTDFIKKYGHLY